MSLTLFAFIYLPFIKLESLNYNSSFIFKFYYCLMNLIKKLTCIIPAPVKKLGSQEIGSSTFSTKTVNI